MNRCIKLAELHSKGKTDTGITKRKRHHTGKAGRPAKAQDLRRELFRWFCGLRRHVKGRFPRSLLKDQAKLIRRTALLEAARLDQYVELPEITSKWLQKFMKDFRISMRSPCTFFKVPRAVFLERCRICWSNVYRARLFIMQHCGYDPEVEGFDQTPFHFNESGSKSKRTLDFTGKKKITLKECSAATRARWTANTYTKSKMNGTLPPLEAMFKGGSGVLKEVERNLEELRASGVHGDLNHVSVNTSPKGSYGLAEVMAFLKRHLEPWSEHRRWKILLCDAFKPHLCAEVRDFCWERGYLMVYIGGGCTGAQQVNDTHLHGPMSRKYQALEMDLLVYASDINPAGLKTMKRGDCLRLLLITYNQRLLHEDASKGYAHNLFTIPLEVTHSSSVDVSGGSEQAKEIFKMSGMVEELPLLVRDMKDEHEAGRTPLTRQGFENLMQIMPQRGHLDVAEDEFVEEWDPESPDEALWNDDEAAIVGTDDKHAAKEKGHAQAGKGTEEDIEDVEEINRWKKKLDATEKIIDDLVKLDQPAVLQAAKRARKELMQQATGKQQMDARIAKAVQRHVDEIERKRKLVQSQMQDMDTS